jgi:hypothetical protein
MKQETKHVGFFEHLLGPGHALESFRADISDLKVCNPREWETTCCTISESPTTSCGLQEQDLVSDASTSLLQYADRRVLGYSRSRFLLRQTHLLTLACCY